MPRNSELPEGTDHIVQGAARTRGAEPAASSGGFVANAASSDGTGGTTRGDLSAATTKFKSQVRDSAQTLKTQAGGKAREYASDGKGRAVGALDEISKAVSEASLTIDEKLGAEYGQYARKAADAVSGFADTLRTKDVDDLYDDARELVRKSPVVAVGIAAAVGFALVRLVKSGLDETPDAPKVKPKADAGA